MRRRTLHAWSLAPLITGLGAGSARAADTRRITVRARVPEGTGTVYLTGNLDELGPWDPSRRAMEGSGRQRRLTLMVPAGMTFEFKLTLGSWSREGLGPGGAVMPNFRVVADGDVEFSVEIAEFKKDARVLMSDWRGSGVLGRLEYWYDMGSRHLRAARHVGVWLPPGYSAAGSQRYPVLVMHDGQNLFDPRIANTGIDWGVDEAVVRSVAAGRMPEVVVVGVWSTDDRIREYSPWHLGPAYARFLIEELLPRVHASFHTLTGPANTATMGSSMGGLIAFELCRRHPGVFGRGGCLSTHFLLSEAQVLSNGSGSRQPYIEREIALGARFPRGPRLYFDHGTAGGDESYEAMQNQVASWLRRQGHREGEDFIVKRFEGALHNEAAWRARLDEPLAFLYRSS